MLRPHGLRRATPSTSPRQHQHAATSAHRHISTSAQLASQATENWHTHRRTSRPRCHRPRAYGSPKELCYSRRRSPPLRNLRVASGVVGWPPRHLIVVVQPAVRVAQQLTHDLHGAVIRVWLFGCPGRCVRHAAHIHLARPGHSRTSLWTRQSRDYAFLHTMCPCCPCMVHWKRSHAAVTQALYCVKHAAGTTHLTDTHTFPHPSPLAQMHAVAPAPTAGFAWLPSCSSP